MFAHNKNNSDYTYECRLIVHQSLLPPSFLIVEALIFQIWCSSVTSLSLPVQFGRIYMLTCEKKGCSQIVTIQNTVYSNFSIPFVRHVLYTIECDVD